MSNKTCETCGAPAKNRYCARIKIAQGQYQLSRCEVVGRAKIAKKRYHAIKDGNYIVGDRGRYYTERLKQKAVKRKCLKCGKEFSSRHIGNRVCELCNVQNTKEHHREYKSTEAGNIIFLR